jgi:hypothetical protein
VGLTFRRRDTGLDRSRIDTASNQHITLFGSRAGQRCKIVAPCLRLSATKVNLTVVGVESEAGQKFKNQRRATSIILKPEEDL